MSQDLTRPFIITETKNGRVTPHAVWDADNEQDYVNRVRAANSRSGEVWSIETAAQAVEFTQERDASSVEMITEADFAAMTPDSWDSRVVDHAIQIGWIDAPAEEDADAEPVVR